jgi:hypothetical protein
MNYKDAGNRFGHAAAIAANTRDPIKGDAGATS